MRGLALVLAAIVLVVHGTVYTVTKEAEFFFVYYSAKPGDTIMVECDINKDLTLDYGGTYVQPITISTTKQVFLTTKGQQDLIITAPYLRLKNFRVAAPVKIADPAHGVRLESMTFFSWMKIGAKDVTMSQVTLNNDVELTGSDITIENSHIKFVGDPKDIWINGPKNVLRNNTFTVQYDYGSSMIPVQTNNTLISYNTFDITFSRPLTDDYYTLIIQIPSKGTGSNKYEWNTVRYSNNIPKTLEFVHAESVNNDHVCASNVVTNGKVSNVKLDQRC